MESERSPTKKNFEKKPEKAKDAKTAAKNLKSFAFFTVDVCSARRLRTNVERRNLYAEREILRSRALAKNRELRPYQNAVEL